MNTTLALIIFSVSVALNSQAAPVAIQLPLETVVYKSAPGADFANAQCLTCHSAEYVSTQPVLPRAFWKGSVEKMISKYGAPIPAEQIEALTDYLAKNYGNERTNLTASSIAPTTIVTPSGMNAKQLLTKSGCVNCHQVEQKFIGPAFKAVAEKYQGHPEGLFKISHQITHGGSGLWGTTPMPPFEQLSQGEVKLIATWILEQK